MKRAWVAAVLLACGQAAAPVLTLAAGAQPPLLATVTVSGMVASVLLENRSAGVVVLPSQVLDSAPLLLEVRDAKGRVVPPLPPPVPTGEVRAIASGDRATCSLSLDAFSPGLKPGDYTVRVRIDGVESNIAPLHVVP